MSFTGKERDAETGYSYFGARYYDSDLSGQFLSVDPMSDKYPSISPYAYCAWNPVKLVDLDGRDVWTVDENGHVKKIGEDGGTSKQTVQFANGHTSVFDVDNYHDILMNLGKENDIKGDSHKLLFHKGNESQGESMANIFYDMATNTNVEWRLDYTKSKQFFLSQIGL